MKILSNYKILLASISLGLFTSCAAVKNNTSIKKIALEQAKQDSLFYRTIFNQTQAAKDSSAVVDFNKVAAYMSNITAIKRKDLGREILKNAKENGIGDYQTGVIKGVKYISNPLTIQTKQKLADRFVFEKLFEKYGVSDSLK